MVGVSVAVVLALVVYCALSFHLSNMLTGTRAIDLLAVMFPAARIAGLLTVTVWLVRTLMRSFEVQAGVTLVAAGLAAGSVLVTLLVRVPRFVLGPEGYAGAEMLKVWFREDLFASSPR